MSTLKYTGKRILFMLFTFLIIISVAFILVRLLPNMPAKQFGKDYELVLKSRYRQGLVDINGNVIVAAGGPSVEDGVITGTMDYYVAGVKIA